MAKQVYTTGQILTAAQMTTLQANDYNQTVSAKVASYTLVAADAGTRITMSNASATTITVNTSIFTAGDTLEITNIGAGVLTVTAGTATVSTSSTLALAQFDTGQLYFTSTGVAIFFMADAASAGGSPLTTKGDLFTFTTVDARLAVGANGETLVADSSESTGLRYIPATVMSNPLINSCYDIWQRGTSITNTAQTIYTADRWATVGTAAAFTISRQPTGDTTNLPNVQFCARVQRNSGETNTTAFNILQGLETTNSIPFAGKTVTLSFYAKAGSNYSPTSLILEAALYSGTGTDQTPTSAFTGQVAVINQNATLTTTWQRFSYSATVGATATQLKTIFSMTPTGTASTNDFFDVTGVQIDIGSVALPIRRNGATIQQELAACQRYYYRVSGTTAYNAWGTGIGISNTSVTIYAPLPVTMRTTPTTLDSSTLAVYDTGTVFAVTSPTINAGESGTGMVTVTCTTSGTAQFRPYKGMFNNSSSAFIGFGAEL